MKEEFRDIEGFEGLYKISNQGRVLSLNYNKTRKEKILKSCSNTDGYLSVGLCKEGKRKMYLVHRLVSEAFIPNSQNLEQINHRDEDKTNNHITNLEWCTNEYNSNYGTRNQRVGESNINHPKRSKQVLCLETGVVYKSIMEAQRQLGFTHQSISRVCTGKRKTYKGLHFKFV